MKNIAIILILLLSVSCHKERVQLPADQEKPTTNLANGTGSELAKLNSYLSLTESRTSKSIIAPGPFKSKSVTAFAMFRDPGVSLTQGFDRVNQTGISIVDFFEGTVSIGDLFTGNTKVHPQNFFYNYYGLVLLTDTTAYTPHWSATGNKTFKSFDLIIPRGLPQITDSLVLRDSAFAAKGYTLNVGKWASNYDSIIVRITGTNSTDVVTLRGGHNTSVFNLSSQQVQQLWGSFGTPECVIVAYNYMHRMQNGKNLLFETGTKLRYRAPFKN